MLLDNGSQKSFITEETARGLELNYLRKERLIVNGFGGREDKLVNLDVVSLKVDNKFCYEKVM